MGAVVWSQEPDHSIVAAVSMALVGLFLLGLLFVCMGAALLVVVVRRRDQQRATYEQAILGLGEARGRQQVLDEVRMLEHGQLKAHVLAVQQCVEQARASGSDAARQCWLSAASEQAHRLLEVVVNLHRAAGASALPDDFEQMLVDVTRSLALAYPTCICDVEVTGRRVTPLSDDLRRALTLGLYNGLINAFTHGRPSRIAVTLRYAPDALILVVADDGQGITHGNAGCSGRGLRDVRQLAASLGGTVSLTDGSAAGTALTMTLPLTRGATRSHSGGSDASLSQCDPASR